MQKRIKWTAVIAAALALQAGLTTIAIAAVHAADSTTNYRVFQNDRAIKEFVTITSATRYASTFDHAHVEKIAGREWVWDNLPRFKVYENGVTSAGREFRTLAEAKQFAGKARFAQIRDLEKPGFVQAAFPNYRMYQGDNSAGGWMFKTLAEAKQAAKPYANIHVMDIAGNQWVWDNLSPAQEDAQRHSEPKYIVTKDGISLSHTSYSFLLDAIRASAQSPGSSVMNTFTGQIVHTNLPSFTVIQSGKALGAYYSIYSAIAYAKTLAGATVVKDGIPWWTNMPYLSVYQGDTLLKTFYTRKSAVQYAGQFTNSSVLTADFRAIWNNKNKLQVLAWNGVSRTSTIMDQVSRTQGLDVDSPSWFELEAADGSFTDASDSALVKTLHASGIKLTPLVSNQFDSKLTSAFLSDPAATGRFIASLVAKLSALGVDGVNVDFENLAGSDRARYTAFIRSLTSAAHQAGLTVSIDLPRGDVSWDAKTAYDHASMAGIVDMIMIMAYDQHWAGSEDAGSVAGLPWVEEGVRQFLSYGIPRDKLMLGIPFYVREWRVNSKGSLVDSKAILMKDVPALIQSQGAQAAFDAASGQTKYTYFGQDGYTHIFWSETAGTVKARLAIAKKYDLAGLAAWRLGFEQATLWNMLLQRK
ncbi:glycosyl hydrolase family 18 protein [Paenibacillus sp. R14(2021)]|uniref:glycosyl hydrolase family 18 protein n=1 Tax=Paenibacillus sp. R14(2021) TaxID=2859228 RepID=UPI001C613513|nr:glycosyl hydrolase family 18 protein [Paenibacillus sp. R14(2021)]